MKTQIAVIQNSKGKFLSAREGYLGNEFVWVSDIAKVVPKMFFVPKVIRKDPLPLDHFPEFEHDWLVQKGIGKAKFVTFEVSYKKVA